MELPLAEMVVGDVAQFKYGNTFPVDGILIEVCNQFPHFIEHFLLKRNKQ